MRVSTRRFLRAARLPQKESSHPLKRDFVLCRHGCAPWCRTLVEQRGRGRGRQDFERRSRPAHNGLPCGHRAKGMHARCMNPAMQLRFVFEISKSKRYPACICTGVYGCLVGEVTTDLWCDFNCGTDDAPRFCPPSACMCVPAVGRRHATAALSTSLGRVQPMVKFDVDIASALTKSIARRTQYTNNHVKCDRCQSINKI